jgi:hypothetical protein
MATGNKFPEFSRRKQGAMRMDLLDLLLLLLGWAQDEVVSLLRWLLYT